MEQMKFRAIYHILAIFLFVLLVSSCNDNLDSVGFTVQPGGDRLKVELDTLELQSKTVLIDSIYSKTKYPILGEYTDPIFGSVKSEYIGEFYYPETSGFKEGAIIDSVKVQVAYTTMMGDSLSPMSLSVYELDKSLKDANRYSDIDPADYVDLSSAPIGKKAFTGKNSTYRTESYTASDYSTVSYTVYEINVDLPNSLGEKFLNEYNKENHGKLTDPDSFRDFFPGLYFTTDFGKSTMIGVDLTTLKMHYHYTDPKGSSTNQDTVRVDSLNLYISADVTQINRFEHQLDESFLDEYNQYTYLKSPAGLMTEIFFPFSEMGDKLKSQALNLANLTVYAVPEEDEISELVKLNPPKYLLLIHRDSLNGFFEKKNLPDDVTSFLSSEFDSSNYSYKFGNISAMVNHYNELSDGEGFDLNYYLVPVNVTFATSTDYYGNTTTTTTPTAVSNQTWPTAVKLDKRQGSLKLDMIFSNF